MLQTFCVHIGWKTNYHFITCSFNQHCRHVLLFQRYGGFFFDVKRKSCVSRERDSSGNPFCSSEVGECSRGIASSFLLAMTKGRSKKIGADSPVPLTPIFIGG